MEAMSKREVTRSAKGATYDSRGKREARRPWLSTPKQSQGLKGRNTCAVLRPFRAGGTLFYS
jgi:hypothetical protein